MRQDQTRTTMSQEMTALTRELERTRNGAKIMERTLEAAKGEIDRSRQELAAERKRVNALRASADARERIASHANLQLAELRATTSPELLASERAANARLTEDLAEAQQDNVSLLHLLALIREACGDNGKRMQDELVEYIRDLRRAAALLEKI